MRGASARNSKLAGFAQFLHGIAQGMELHGDVAGIAQLGKFAKNIGIVDFAGAGMMAPGHVGDVDEIEFLEDERWLRVRRGGFEIACNFSPTDRMKLRCGAGRIRVATSPDVRLEGETGPRAQVNLPPLSGALLEGAA